MSRLQYMLMLYTILPNGETRLCPWDEVPPDVQRRIAQRLDGPPSDPSLAGWYIEGDNRDLRAL